MNLVKVSKTDVSISLLPHYIIPYSAKVKWTQKDDTESGEAVVTSDKFEVKEDGSLTINSLLPENSGVYNAEVNVEGNLALVVFNLAVTGNTVCVWSMGVVFVHTSDGLVKPVNYIIILFRTSRIIP